MKSHPLDRLGHKVAEALGDGPGPNRVQKQRERILAAVQEDRRPEPASASVEFGLGPQAPSSRRPWRWLKSLGWATGALAAVLGAFVLWQTHHRPGLEHITCTTGDGAQVREGTWLVAPSKGPLALRFSEGSRLRLSPNSRMRLVRMRASGVTVVLEAGRIDSDIVHAASRKWRFLVGPYQVVVLGTRFTLDWTPGSARLLLDVWRGRLLVTGGLAGEGITVSTGNRLDLEGATHRVAKYPIPQEPDSVAPRVPGNHLPLDRPHPSRDAGVQTPPRTQPHGDTMPGPSGQEGAKRRTRRSGTDSRPPPWKRLMSEGRYREAFAEVRRYGLDRLARGLDAWELLRLSDLARLAGRPNQAKLLLLRLRDRFPGSGASAQAAFRLGKLSFDQFGRLKEAVSWFHVVLRERPGRNLEEAAAGRLVEALWRIGRGREAAQWAKRYLNRFPNGPHATLARQILREYEKASRPPVSRKAR